MHLPRELNMKEIAHGTKAKGGGFYLYEDDLGLGVVALASRETSRERFTDIWRFKWLPDAEFITYDALRDGVAALTDEAVAAEKAKWPQPGEPTQERELEGGKCWIHTDLRGTHLASVHTCWIPALLQHAVLCAECAAAAATDIDVIVRAAEARKLAVAQRRAAEKRGERLQ